MTRRMFGWSLPPGVSQRDIDEQSGGDYPCDTCGHDPADCICPECPQCGESGNEYCYDHGHLTYTTAQHIGRTRAKLAKLEDEVTDAYLALHHAREALEVLLEKQDDEDQGGT